MKIRVLAAVLDTSNLVLYHEDGNTTDIPQGDARVRTIIDAISPILANGGVAEVELTPGDSSYKDFEEKSSGLVRFFRVAKSKVASLFNFEEPMEPRTYGRVPVPADAAAKPDLTRAIDDIMTHAVSVQSETYVNRPVQNNETMVAVIGDTVIPGVEKIKDQILHSTKKTANTKSVTNFLTRCGAIIADRGHTVQELLHFIEKGDLPLADDGSIIAYKVLMTIDGLEKGYFVDCHTRRVTQRVGSYVCQDEKIISTNRRQECGTGLHVARRGYLSGFRGDIITLIKIAPEDVIAVPMGEPNKMRVKGYQILAVIPSEAHAELRSNRPMTGNTTCGKLLGMAIRGEFPKPIEEVRVTGASGSSIVVTSLTPEGERPVKAPKVTKNMPVVEAIEIETETHKPRAPVVNPKQVAQEVTKTKTVQAASMSNAQKAAAFLAEMGASHPLATRKKAASDLVALKKGAKVGWGKLNIPNTVESRIAEIMAEQPAPKPVKAPVAAPITEAKPNRAQQADALYTAVLNSNGEARKAAITKLTLFKKLSKVGWDKLGLDPKMGEILERLGKAPVEAPKPEPVKLPENETKAQEIARLIGYITNGKTSDERVDGALQLNTLKKASKKSWAALGVSDKIVSTIQTLLA